MVISRQDQFERGFVMAVDARNREGTPACHRAQIEDQVFELELLGFSQRVSFNARDTQSGFLAICGPNEERMLFSHSELRRNHQRTLDCHVSLRKDLPRLQPKQTAAALLELPDNECAIRV